MIVRWFASFVCALALFVPVLRAATYLVPPDAEMIQRADEIVVATAIGSRVERDARGAIVTRHVLRVERVLKGESAAGEHLALTEQGGILDGKARVIGGTPSYEAGKPYLVFTSTDAAMEPTTYGMALGQFFLLDTNGRKLAVRAGVSGFDGNLAAHEESPRDLTRFEHYIRAVAAQRYAPADYFVAATQTEAMKVAANAGFTRGSYLLTGNFRWQTPSAGFVLSGGRPDSQPPIDIPTAGADAAGVAVSTWSGAGAGISYSVDGTDHTAIQGLMNDDGKHAILFGDPNGEVASRPGAVAIGGAFGDVEYRSRARRSCASSRPTSSSAQASIPV